MAARQVLLAGLEAGQRGGRRVDEDPARDAVHDNPVAGPDAGLEGRDNLAGFVDEAAAVGRDPNALQLPGWPNA